MSHRCGEGASPAPSHNASVMLGTPQFLCVIGALSVHDFLLLGVLTSVHERQLSLSLCPLDQLTVGPASPLCPLSLCLAAACILVHKHNRSYIAQHALMALWWCVSDSDFSSLQPQSCSPLNQCLAGGSVKSLSSRGKKNNLFIKDSEMTLTYIYGSNNSRTSLR